MSGLVDKHGRPLRPSASQFHAYKGTTQGRNRGWMYNQVQDSRQTLNSWSRTSLCGYARTLYRDCGEVKGAVQDLARYSVGPGIRPQSQSARSQEYEDFFNSWAKGADLTRERSFWGLQRMASIRMDVDGDCGFVMVNGANDWPFLQPIEGHRIASPTTDSNIHDGVAISPKTGRAVSYYVREGDKKFRKVRADDFIMIYDPDRVAQYRGESGLAHAITDLWDASEILEFEKLGVKIREAIGAVITTHGGVSQDGNSLIEDGYTAEDTGDFPWQTVRAGWMPRFKPGESIVDLKGNRPSPTFQGFLELLMRKTALGLGLPFEFVWDPTNAGGATQRAVLAKAQRKFSERANLLDERLNTRVWMWVIAKGIKRGDIGFDDGWYKVRWQHPKKITVDVGREAKESREDLKFGSKTLAEDAGERGLDWLDIRKQSEIEVNDLIARAKAISDAHGIDMSLALSLLQQRSSNPPIEATITSE